MHTDDAATPVTDAQTADVRQPVHALRRSHDRLVATLDAVGPDAITGASYCDDWTIAQVCSHLGSGAEISALALAAAIAGTDPPGSEIMQPIWDTWNARPPAEQVAQCIISDRSYVEALEAMSIDELAATRTKLFGMLDVDGFGLAGVRLAEHAIHTWDIAVELDPDARILPDAIDIIVDGTLLLFAGFVGRPQPEPWTLVVRPSAPTCSATASAWRSSRSTPCPPMSAASWCSRAKRWCDWCTAAWTPNVLTGSRYGPRPCHSTSCA